MTESEIKLAKFHYHMDSFMRVLNAYINERKHHEIKKEFIYMNELRKRALVDENFMDTMILWFTEGSTLRFRDQLLKKIDGLFNFHDLDDFNSFALLDTIGYYYLRNYSVML